MNGVSDIHAGFIAIAALVLGFVLLAATAVSAWRAWKRFDRSRRAAEALIDVHTARLEATIVTAGSEVARVGTHAADLTSSAGDLIANGQHLAWMLRTIPDERDRLQRALLDIVLPTRRNHDEPDREPAR